MRKWWSPKAWRARNQVQESSDSWEVLRGIFGPGVETAAGAMVTPTTAMRVSAVYGCVRLIAGAIASLPVHVYERVDGERRRIDHDYWWLLNEQPIAAFSASAFWEFMVAQVLLRGDGLAYIRRNRAGMVTGLIPLQRGQVAIRKMLTGNPREAYRLHYYVNTDNGYFGVDQDDILHFPGLGFDGVESLSVIQWGARNGTGIALKADEFAGKFFGKGAQPQHALTTENKMTQTQQDSLREAWLEKY